MAYYFQVTVTLTSDLGSKKMSLSCLSRPFSQATSVQNCRLFTMSFFNFSGLKADLVERLHKYYKEVCLTLKTQMDSSFWFDTINLGWPIVYLEGSLFPNEHVLLSLKMILSLQTE